LSKDNFYFSGDELYSDDSLFPSNGNFDKNSPHFDITNFASLQASISNMNAFALDVYLSFYYRVNPSYSFMKRTYKKIPDVFAQILPFLQLAMIFSQILVAPFRSHALVSEIINEVFIENNKRKTEHLKNENKISTSSAYLKPEAGLSIYLHKKVIVKSNVDSNLSKPQVNTKLIKENEVSNNPRISKLLVQTVTKYTPPSGNIFRFCSPKKDKFILSQFKSKIKRVLEINSFFNIHSELDKLQSLLLTKDQKQVLPLWSYNYSVDASFNVNTQWLRDKDEITQKSMSAYNNISNKTEKSQIDSKLLSEIEF
jgi:hypothetical protein